MAMKVKNKGRQRRESRHVKVARIIYAQTKAVLPRYSHQFSPKKFTLPQLGACVLLSFYFPTGTFGKMSYRDFEELLLMSRELRELPELIEVPNFSTLSRMYHRFRASHLDKLNQSLLDTMNANNGDSQPAIEDTITLDSTGYSPTTASAYYQIRRGQPFKHWLKGAYAVGTRSQMILAVTHGIGPSNDTPHLSTLKRRARRYGRCDARGRSIWVTLADSGFDSATIGPRDIIPPIRGGGSLKAPERKARLDLVSHARLDGLFGQRWKNEAVNSVIKRKFGAAVRSIKRAYQNRESHVKAFVTTLIAEHVFSQRGFQLSNDESLISSHPHSPALHMRGNQPGASGRWRLSRGQRPARGAGQRDAAGYGCMSARHACSR